MIEYIPVGKENKSKAEEIMKLANINDLNEFKNEIKRLRQEYIIFSDKTTGEYWRTNNKEELQEFIKNIQGKSFDASKTIMLAYKELENINGK